MGVGRRPVILGANASDVSAYGQVKQVFHIRTRRDTSSLVTAPDGTWSLTINVWMTTISSSDATTPPSTITAK
jgi:hypothetical protein